MGILNAWVTPPTQTTNSSHAHLCNYWEDSWECSIVEFMPDINRSPECRFYQGNIPFWALIWNVMNKFGMWGFCENSSGFGYGNFWTILKYCTNFIREYTFASGQYSIFSIDAKSYEQRVKCGLLLLRIQVVSGMEFFAQYWRILWIS